MRPQIKGVLNYYQTFPIILVKITAMQQWVSPLLPGQGFKLPLIHLN